MGWAHIEWMALGFTGNAGLPDCVADFDRVSASLVAVSQEMAICYENGKTLHEQTCLLSQNKWVLHY